jgi:hypothetical protein
MVVGAIRVITRLHQCRVAAIDGPAIVIEDSADRLAIQQLAEL